MKIKMRRDDASMLEMNDWIAELRDDDHAEPAGDAHAEPAAGAHAEPAAGARAEPAAGARAEPAAGARAEPEGDGGLEPGATAVAPRANRLAANAEVSIGAGASVCAEITEPSAIGDQLRIPIAWCEMGSCISHHADRAALGEADIRARAILAGWCVDALGRLACLRCQQNGAGFRASRPVALWDRDAAITRALLMTAALRAGVFKENRT